MQPHKPILSRWMWTDGSELQPLNLIQRPGTWSATPWLLDDHRNTSSLWGRKSGSHWTLNKNHPEGAAGVRGQSAGRLNAESARKHWYFVTFLERSIAFIQLPLGWIIQNRVRITGFTLPHQRWSLNPECIIRTRPKALPLLKGRIMILWFEIILKFMQC